MAGKLSKFDLQTAFQAKNRSWWRQFVLTVDIHDLECTLIFVACIFSITLVYWGIFWPQIIIINFIANAFCFLEIPTVHSVLKGKGKFRLIIQDIIIIFI